MIVQIGKVPDNMFYRVTMVKDVRQASFIDRKNRKVGEPDVILVSPLGYSDRITRNDLMRNFRSADNTKIKIRYWKYSRKYTVIAPTNNNMAALMVPNNSKTQLIMPNNSAAKQGSIIICPLNDMGDLVKGRSSVVSKKTFDKMFRVDTRPTMYSSKPKRNNNRDINDNKKEINSNSKSNDVRTKYLVTHRIINNVTGKIEGFVVTDGKAAKKLSLSQVITLCRLKKMDNITLVEKDDKEFLRGVGIRIENLPAISR